MNLKKKTLKIVFALFTSVVALSFSAFAAGAITGTGTVDANGGLNLRSAQNTTSQRLTIIPNNSNVQINYENDQWYHITYDNKSGFVMKSYIKTIKQITDGVVTSDEGLRLRKSAAETGEIIATMPKNTSVKVLETHGQWLKVSVDGKEGFCSSAYIAFTNTENGQPQNQAARQTGKVSADGGLRLRSTADAASAVILTMPNGSGVTVIEKSGEWLRVQYGTQAGYCSSEYVELATNSNAVTAGSAVVVAEGGLSLRTVAAASGNRITVIPNGSNVSVEKTENGWSAIRYGTYKGFVSAEFLATQTNSVKDSDVAAYAKQFLGVPYVYGGASPSGFDCSGLVYYVYKNFGITLNHSASMQMNNGTPVEQSNLQSGDLVFFYQYGTNLIGHVGIYIGNGDFIHSPQKGDVVKIASLTSGNYPQRYAGARRITN